MTLNELINKKTQLKIDGKVIKDTYIKSMPINKLSVIKTIQDGNEEEKMEAMQDIIIFSIVDKNGESAINKDELTMELINKFIDPILTANGLGGEDEGKQIEESKGLPNT